MRVDGGSSVGRFLGAAPLVLAALLALAPGAAGAQSARYVRVEGRVQWLAGQNTVVRLDTGPSVNVDLARVPQEQYSLIALGDRVLVTGVISDDDRRVIAASVIRR